RTVLADQSLPQSGDIQGEGGGQCLLGAPVAAGQCHGHGTSPYPSVPRSAICASMRWASWSMASPSWASRCHSATSSWVTPGMRDHNADGGMPSIVAALPRASTAWASDLL